MVAGKLDFGAMADFPGAFNGVAFETAGKHSLFISVLSGSIKGSGNGIVVPQGARHNVIATGSEPLKLYTIYGPPEHIDGTVHKTPAEAHAAHEHFDGRTTE